MTSVRDELRGHGIVWVIAGAVVVVIVAAVSVSGLRREEGLEARAAQADSVKREKVAEAVILRRDATRDRIRADSAVRDAAAARAELHALADRAAASSARVDRSTLAPDIAQALADADTFRLAVTPTLVKDSLAIERGRAAYDRLAESYAAQGAALVASDAEVRAVRAEHAPRCGWKCGAAIGVAAVEILRAAVAAIAR